MIGVRKRVPGSYRDKDLVYAATARCPCGAGLAHTRRAGLASWDCSSILKGDAIEEGAPGSVQHTDPLPFTFYEIKSEAQPSAKGATTRP
jgi:hypothetical protein